MNKKVYVDLSQQDVQDIINAYEKDIEKFNKQKEVLDKIKEKLKENRVYISGERHLAFEIEEILEEIE
jgi:hypothetical protein